MKLVADKPEKGVVRVDIPRERLMAYSLGLSYLIQEYKREIIRLHGLVSVEGREEVDQTRKADRLAALRKHIAETEAEQASVDAVAQATLGG